MKHRFFALRAVALCALTALASSAHAGLLYATTPDNRVLRIDTVTSVVTTFASGLHTPIGVALDAAGNVYVSSFDDKNILKFNPAGVSSVFATTGTAYAEQMAFDAAGNLYAPLNNNSIVKITAAGVSSVFANTLLSGPNGLAFDASGNLYAGNGGNSTIVKFTPAGVGSVVPSSGLNTPQDLKLDSAGNIYTSNTNRNIVKTTAAGVSSIFFTDTVGLFPLGMAFDAANTLYVSDYAGGGILKILPSGASSVLATLAGGSVYYLAYQATPVPEPSTAMLLMLGGAGVLTAFKTRRTAPIANTTA